MAGKLGPVSLGAHAIVLNLASLSFTFSLGISVAAAVRVGNLIGAGDTQGARRAAAVRRAQGCLGSFRFMIVPFVVVLERVSATSVLREMRGL